MTQATAIVSPAFRLVQWTIKGRNGHVTFPPHYGPRSIPEALAYAKRLGLVRPFAVTENPA